MTAGTIIILFLFTFAASLIQRISGFGFGIFVMTAFPMLMPSFAEATALSGSLAVFVALLTAIRTYKYLNWKKLWLILGSFLISSFFFVLMVSKVNDQLMKHILGVVMILVSLYFMFFSKSFRMKPTAPVQVTMGTLSGAMGGLFAMQGPPAVIYFIACTEDKNEYMALTQWYFLIGNLMMTVFRAGNGFVTREVGISWLLGMPAVCMGLWIGSVIYKSLNIQIVRKIVYAYLAIAGLLALMS